MLKVVLADDENKVILLMRKLIDWEALGYEVVGIANDGLHALELVQTQQPHLLITDIRMPGCDGIELIRRAKEMQPRLHFLCPADELNAVAARHPDIGYKEMRLLCLYQLQRMEAVVCDPNDLIAQCFPVDQLAHQQNDLIFVVCKNYL